MTIHESDKLQPHIAPEIRGDSVDAWPEQPPAIYGNAAFNTGSSDHDSLQKKDEDRVPIDLLEEKFDSFLERIGIEPSSSAVKKSHIGWMRERKAQLSMYEAGLWKLSPFLFQYVHETFTVEDPSILGFEVSDAAGLPNSVLRKTLQGSLKQRFFDLMDGQVVAQELAVDQDDSGMVFEGNAMKARSVTKAWARALEDDGLEKGKIIDFIENSAHVISSVLDGKDPFEGEESWSSVRDKLTKWFIDLYQDADEMKITALADQLKHGITPEELLSSHEKLAQALGRKAIIEVVLAGLASGNITEDTSNPYLG